MRNLFQICPNEDLIGFIGRLHYLGVFRRYEDTRKYLGLTTRRLEPGRLTYKDEFKIAQLLEASMSDLASEHSTRKLLTYCMTGQEIAAVSKPKTQNKMSAVTFYDGKGIEKHPWRWCPKCVEADQLQFGTAYYHRNHQLPGVHTCYKHGCSLNEECVKCGFRAESLSDAFVPPRDGKCPNCGSREYNGKVNLSDKMVSVERYMLAMASGKLEEDFHSITNRVLWHIGIDKEWIESRCGLVYVREFYRRLLDFFDLDTLSEYFNSAMVLNQSLRCRTLCNSRLFDTRDNHIPAHPLVYALVLVYLDAHHNEIPIAA